MCTSNCLRQVPYPLVFASFHDARTSDIPCIASRRPIIFNSSYYRSHICTTIPHVHNTLLHTPHTLQHYFVPLRPPLYMCANMPLSSTAAHLHDIRNYPGINGPLSTPSGVQERCMQLLIACSGIGLYWALLSVTALHEVLEDETEPDRKIAIPSLHRVSNTNCIARTLFPVVSPTPDMVDVSRDWYCNIVSTSYSWLKAYFLRRNSNWRVITSPRGHILTQVMIFHQS